MSKKESLISKLRQDGFEVNSISDIINIFKSQKDDLSALECSKLRHAAFLLHYQGVINVLEFKSLLESASKHLSIIEF